MQKEVLQAHIWLFIEEQKTLIIKLICDTNRPCNKAMVNIISVYCHLMSVTSLERGKLIVFFTIPVHLKSGLIRGIDSLMEVAL